MANDQLIEQVDELLTVEHFDEEVRRQLLALGPDALTLLRQYATGSHPSRPGDGPRTNLRPGRFFIAS